MQRLRALLLASLVGAAVYVVSWAVVGTFSLTAVSWICARLGASYNASGLSFSITIVVLHLGSFLILGIAMSRFLRERSVLDAAIAGALMSVLLMAVGTATGRLMGPESPEGHWTVWRVATLAGFFALQVGTAAIGGWIGSRRANAADEAVHQ